MHTNGHNFYFCIIGTESNFVKLSSTVATTNGVPYDYRSIMHYSAYAFSYNGQPTIDTLNGVSRSQLGQRNGFSAYDLSHVQELYCSPTERKYIFNYSLSICIIIPNYRYFCTCIMLLKS